MVADWKRWRQRRDQYRYMLDAERKRICRRGKMISPRTVACENAIRRLNLIAYTWIKQR